MRNKNILVIIHKSYNEFDWLSPIVAHLQIKNNIFFLFTNYINYFSFIKDSKGYRILSKAKKKIIIKKYNFFFFKILRLLYKKLKIYKNRKFENFLESKIHNIDKIYKYFLPKNKKEFDIIFSQNGLTSGWTNQFYFKKKKTIIINHPATSLLPSKHSTLPSKAKPRGDYMLVNNETEKKMWKKQYDEKKIIIVGMPKLNFYTKPKKNLNINKKVVFAYSSNFKRFDFKTDLILEKQLEEVMNVLSKIKNITVYIKIHPIKNHPHFLKILKKFENNFFSVSNQNLNDLACQSDLLITNLDSSAVLDGLLCKIPTIELWRVTKKINNYPYSFFSSNSLSKHCKNKYELKKYAELALKFPSNSVWQKQQIQFKKIYGYKKINYDYLFNKFLQNY
jgi:hypothetical protein